MSPPRPRRCIRVPASPPPSRYIRKAHKLAPLLQAGTVWINCYGNIDSAVPFGGYKDSGYGRDGGRDALEKFLHTKAVWTNLA